MGGGEGTSNGDITAESVQCLKTEVVINGFGSRIGKHSGDCGSRPGEGFRTYKRRKHTKSSSESKGQEDGRGSVEAASKLADETANETPDCLPEKHTSLDGSNDVSHKQSRNFVLESIYQSLKNDKGGIQGCIRDALLMTVKVWKKLQGIGNDLISLAKSLSDVSFTCCNEQFSTREFKFHCKSEKIDSCGVYSVCTCWRCGDKADGRDCLVCDSCEEMYHVSCIEPAVKEIPPKSWYCASCTAVGMGSPHENCVVCERLNAPRTLCDEAGDEKVSSTIEKIFSEFEETSNCTGDDFCQPPAGSKNVCVCKFCGNEVENGEKLRICEHVLCPYKYYHVRCLTTNLLKSHGPLWYCPSCLCRVCLTDKDDTKIVLCDGCDNAYHMYCMNPPRTTVPKGKWFCRQCDVKIKEIRKARRAYEKRGYRMKRKIEAGKRACENLEEKLDEKCEQESVKDREPMDMLLKAALYEEKLAGV
ncbi:PHD finger protein EHD3 isoform X2 [Hevea brasiliensis]|uniref:PHD finger protein EHD3 isoform X2 n=1 Tax=Hevea brasiliensis TaxID=3981 RepID=UPI000B78D54D|nr:PHD finger protein EHD3 isoform X2 [Hevea brasiliensis]